MCLVGPEAHELRRDRTGPAEAPRICCLDLYTFFVSVECILDPTLEGKPVAEATKLAPKHIA